MGVRFRRHSQGFLCLLLAREGPENMMWQRWRGGSHIGQPAPAMWQPPWLCSGFVCGAKRSGMTSPFAEREKTFDFDPCCCLSLLITPDHHHVLIITFITTLFITFITTLLITFITNPCSPSYQPLFTYHLVYHHLYHHLVALITLLTTAP